MREADTSVWLAHLEVNQNECPTNSGTSDQVASVNELAATISISYREAVATSSPTLPLGGYVWYGRMEEGATP
jgi:hypothetical protein